MLLTEGLHDHVGFAGAASDPHETLEDAKGSEKSCNEKDHGISFRTAFFMLS